MQTSIHVVVALATLFSANAFQLLSRASTKPHKIVAMQASDSSSSPRRQFLDVSLASGCALLFSGKCNAAATSGTTASGIKYNIVREGDGPTPAVGELVAIRFKGSYKGNAFDDILTEGEPYYYRVGSFNLIKGIEEAVQLMKIGSRWELEIPGNLAFGDKGRSASPGKPRIPPGASIDYILEIVSLPGKEPELIDLIGDDL